MDRISDEELNEYVEMMKKAFGRQNGNHKVEFGKCGSQNIMASLIELKERREADSNPLDIKAQLRLVRDRCPDMWKLILAENCPDSWGLERTIKILCEQCYPDCKECWDKALEGDE